MAAKRKKRDVQWQGAVWAKSGRIYVKANDSTVIKNLTSFHDLQFIS